MAVNALPETLSSNPPSTNKRLPPLADRSSLSFKLQNLSKQKLAREATAPDPDIRRCLTHFRLHVRSLEWAQQEMATKITSFEFEDDESEDEDIVKEDQDEPMVLPSPDVEVEAQSEVAATVSSKEAEQTIHVHFEVVPMSEEKDKDAGIVDKGRRCFEKAQKPFWPSPAQCMPVRIAG
ncbi:hypothetical protein BJX70DRAFT_358066 [Aspergillus crustosus]